MHEEAAAKKKQNTEKKNLNARNHPSPAAGCVDVRSLLGGLKFSISFPPLNPLHAPHGPCSLFP